MLLCVRAVVVLTLVGLAVCSPFHKQSLIYDIVNPSGSAYDSRFPGWTHIAQVNGTEMVELTIALRQRNTDEVVKIWNRVADPENPQYGHFLTDSELGALIQPDAESVKAVLDWLLPHNASEIHFTRFREFVRVKLSSSSAETLLGVRLGRFRHSQLRGEHIRTRDPIILPPHISSLVDCVTGVTDFSVHRSGVQLRGQAMQAIQIPQVLASADPTVPAPSIQFANNGNHEVEVRFLPLCPGPYLCSQDDLLNFITGFTLKLSFDNSALDQSVTVPVTGVECEVYGDDKIHQCSFPVSNVTNWAMFNVSIATNFLKGGQSSFGVLSASLICGPWALPSLIDKLYNITTEDRLASSNPRVQAGSTSGVILFEYQFYSPDDMGKFLVANNLPGTPAALVAPTDPNDPTQPGDEGQADIELIAASGVGGAASTYWYSTNGGDGVLQWALQIADTPDDQTPKVWSLSWGIAESDFDEQVGVGAQSRIEIELAKMGVRGLTLVVASGDAGVRPIGRSVGTCGVFEPDYPASSQYVLSVSATMLKQAKAGDVPVFPATGKAAADLPICQMGMEGVTDPTISCDETGLDEAKEVAVSCCSDGAVWTTGGGFSNNYTRPSWQEWAVKRYLESQHDVLPPSYLWNSTGRAYPDISIIGDKVPTLLYGRLSNFGGTSASAPIMAGLISLLNSQRLQAGRPLLGPVTPLLYRIAASDPNSFRDIVEGHSNCGEMMCCEYGFSATNGWDSVTGLGTPNFGLLKTLV